MDEKSGRRGVLFRAVIGLVCVLTTLWAWTPNLATGDSVGGPYPEPTGILDATPTLTLDNTVETVEGQIESLGQRRKDIWDKIEAVSGLVTGGVVTILALIATLAFRQREQRIQKTHSQQEHMVSMQQVAISKADIVHKFMPYLLSEDPRERQMGLSAIGAVDEELLARLSRQLASSPNEGVVQSAKDILIRQMASSDRELAAAAVDELRHKGWLTDGSLEHVHLGGSNLEGADLRDANLKAADLSYTNLEDTNLERANLQSANLERADLEGANLHGANLWFANLEWAKVTSDQITEALSLSGAILPDGTELSDDDWEADFEAWREKWG